MCIRIGVEDLAANALIELMKKSEENRFVSYSMMEAYGLAVAEILEDEGEKVIMIVSRADTDAMLWNYSDFFIEEEHDGEKGILLRDGKTIDDLRKRFRGYLGMEALLAFVNENSVRLLRVAYA